jgi:hypothetical protein
VLNHSERGDVTAIYDRHSYDNNEKRDTLTRWDKRIERILAGDRAKVNRDARLATRATR